MLDVLEHLQKAAEAMHRIWVWLPIEMRPMANETRNEILLAMGEYVIEDIDHHNVSDALKAELAKMKAELKKLEATTNNNED